MITLALNVALEQMPSEKSRKNLLASLGKIEDSDEALPLEHILDYSGLDSAFRCLHALDKQYRTQIAVLGCNFAESVLYVFEYAYPDDDRPRKAIEAKRLWSMGAVSDEYLNNTSAAAINLVKTMPQKIGTAFLAANAATWASISPKRSAGLATHITAIAATGAMGHEELITAEKIKQAGEFRRFCRLKDEYKEVQKPIIIADNLPSSM